jgi:hypothetical protein
MTTEVSQSLVGLDSPRGAASPARRICPDRITAA